MISLLTLTLLAQSTLNQSLPLTREADGGWAVRVWMDTSLVCSGGSGGSGAPTDSSYITRVPEAGLSAETALSALDAGILLHLGGGNVGAYAGSACAANQYASAAGVNGALACAQVTTAQLSGTVSNSQLASSYSGVGACGANQWASTLSANAAPACTQPAFSNLSGSATQAQGGTGAGALTCTNQFVTSNGSAYSCSTDTLASAQHANQGTATTLLHGNAAGNPTWAGVSLTADTTANQGTTTTVLHGNAAGQPSFSAVNLANDTTGTLTVALGGTGAAPGAGDQVLVSDSTSGATWRAVPDCTDATGNHLNYTAATNLFSCGTSSSGGGAPTTATYWTATSEAGLSAEVNLGALTTGLLKHTVSAGTSTPATASAGTDYGPPTSGNATGLVISTTTTGAHTAYAGTSCTNQFPRSLNASGAATCASVASADLSITATSCTNQFVSAVSTTGTGTCTTDTLASAQHANQGTATTLLHGNAAGNPTWSGVALADHVANLGTTTTLLHGNAAGQPSYAGVLLADFTANQGTATTVLHGNAAGQPTFGGVSISDHTATGTPSATTYLRGDNTWATPAGGGGGYATIQDETTPLTARTVVNFTGAGVACVDNSGASRTDCTISGGGAGSANVVGVDVTLSGPVGSTVVTGQTWVTSSSKVVCAPQFDAASTGNNTAEVHLVASLVPLVTDLINATGFTVYVYDAHQFGLSGTFHFSCTGV